MPSSSKALPNPGFGGLPPGEVDPAAVLESRIEVDHPDVVPLEVMKGAVPVLPPLIGRRAEGDLCAVFLHATEQPAHVARQEAQDDSRGGRTGPRPGGR